MGRNDLLGIFLITLGVFLAVFLVLRNMRTFTFSSDEQPSQVSASSLNEEDAKRTISLRARLLGLGVGVSAIFAGLFVRLWSMQVIESQEYQELSDKNRTRQITTSGPRGRILDRNGEVLVGNRLSLVALAEKDVLTDTLLMKRLANVVGLPYEVVRRHIQDESQGSAAKRLVAMDLSMKTAAYIVEHPGQFPHITIESRSVRHYPHASLAAHILGYTGTISQEELEKNKGDEDAPIKYTMGDEVGKTGIEAQYEEVLQGIAGAHTIQVDAHGKLMNFVEDIPASPGNDIQLTIDIKLQEKVEKYLQDAIRLARSTGNRNANGGAAVVLEVNTGNVVAMASYPTYDPTNFVGGIGTETWENLTADDAHNPLSNRAIAGLYPAASTIKSFSALSALENGFAELEQSYYCPGRWKGFGDQWAKWCWKHDGHGGISLKGGIVHSCDCVFYDIGKAVVTSATPEALQATYKKWGLGEKTEIDLPGEAIGRIPDAHWKAEHYKNGTAAEQKWVYGDTVNMVIGQGDVLVTPLQIVNSYCAIANTGNLMKPSILKAVLANDAKVNVVDKKPTVKRNITCDPDHLTLVREGLRGVVAEGSIRSYYSGMKNKIAGKTGTAEVANKGDYAWFVGYGPYDEPEYATVVIVEQGGGGGTTAAPAVRHIFGELFDEPVANLKVEVDNSR